MPLHQEEVVEWISYAYGKDHYEADPELRDLLRHFWPGAGDREAELLAWGAYMGREVYEAAYHIDQDAGPELVMHDLDGNRVDRVRLSPVQREVLKRLRPIVRPPYEGGSWHHHFALGYLLADGGLYCILTITHQVAYPIHKYAPGLASWKERVLYGEAFGATWMTEIQGEATSGRTAPWPAGKGRSGAFTGGQVLRLGGGACRCGPGDGAARGGAPWPQGAGPLPPAQAGPRGAPELPGAPPQAEKRYPGRALGGGGAGGERGLPHRPGGGGDLLHPGDPHRLPPGQRHRRHGNCRQGPLGDAAAGAAAAELREVPRGPSPGAPRPPGPLRAPGGGLALALAAVEAFDRAWHERPPYGEAYHLARFLSHLAKNRTAEHSAEITRLAMELFGGLGFLEEYAVARWHRESLITPIWEGPSNIQALDLLEAMQKKGAHRPFLAWLEARLKGRSEEAEGPWRPPARPWTASPPSGPRPPSSRPRRP